AGLPVPGTTKSVVSLNTCPVGAPPGVDTTSGTIDTGLRPRAPLYSVETSVPLSDTHSGVLGPCDIPQAFTRFGSVIAACPGWSETRLVWVNVGPNCCGSSRLCAPAVSGYAIRLAVAALVAIQRNPRYMCCSFRRGPAHSRGG